MTKTLAISLTAASLLVAPFAQAQSCTSSADCEDAACLDGVCTVRTVAPDPSPDTKFETHTHWPLAIAGASVFGASWVATIAMAGATKGDNQDSAAVIGGAAVPVAGPLLLRSEGTAPPNETVDSLLVVMTALQAMGLLTAVVGATIDSKVVVEGDIALAPTFSSEGTGLVAIGRF